MWQPKQVLRWKLNVAAKTGGRSVWQPKQVEGECGSQNVFSGWRSLWQPKQVLMLKVSVADKADWRLKVSVAAKVCEVFYFRRAWTTDTTKHVLIPQVKLLLVISHDTLVDFIKCFLGSVLMRSFTCLVLQYVFCLCVWMILSIFEERLLKKTLI